MQYKKFHFNNRFIDYNSLNAVASPRSGLGSTCPKKKRPPPDAKKVNGNILETVIYFIIIYIFTWEREGWWPISFSAKASTFMNTGYLNDWVRWEESGGAIYILLQHSQRTARTIVWRTSNGFKLIFLSVQLINILIQLSV